MKRISFFLLSILFAAQLGAQGIDFFHGTWQEALAEAKKTGRPIFVDCYAKWCGPCKRMAATTFMDNTAGEFFNENYINVKMDAEEGEGKTFRQKYPVSAYPTLFFIDEKGEVLHKAVGGQTVEGLITLGKQALAKIDFSREHQQNYEAGKRDPQFVYEYLQSLNKSKKPSLAVANEYLRTQQDLTTEFNLRFIFEAATESDSRIFKLLLEHRTAIEKLEGEQAVLDRIQYACQNTVVKAMEYESEDLLAEAKENMRKHHPAKADAFAAQADLDFYRAKGNAEKYGQACADYVKFVANDSPEELSKLVADMLKNFPEHAECMKMAEKFAKQAADSGKQYNHYLTYATILQKNGKTKLAKKAADQALDLAKGTPGEQEVKRFIEKLDS